ncbi:cysteine--tRNA ligase [Candidatus Sumerlaeota bacterium]|nr:cysteine--tRNA ligase [Candidatus Sumerlaeota bacterium]
MRIHSTASRGKVDFEPLEPGRVLFYNCGPTVYDHFHIGNARNFVVMDVIRRHLRHRGFDVRFVQNITDIDDKIINRAREEGKTPQEIAQTYTEYYFNRSGLLGVEPADVHPRATEHIPQIIGLVERLIERDLAYSTPSGDVYFRVREFKPYGELSGRNIDDLREGARVDPSEEKEDPLDFALWKASKPGEPQWDSPWGPGRPGWHIECTAMIHTHLGETIDIHAGGSDLIFPHHENERAQSMGATGQEYVRHWIHNGFLNIEGEKMSKSLGNFRTIEDVLAEFSPLTVRFFLLSAHYRNPLDFSRENLAAAATALRRLTDCLTETANTLRLLGVEDGSPEAEWIAKYDEAMDDDFNSQRAIGVIFELVADVNERRAKRDPDDSDRASLANGLATLRTLCDLLGLDPALDQRGDSSGVNPELAAFAEEIGATPSEQTEEAILQSLIERRAAARKERDFATADAVRGRLGEMGYILQDTAHGTTWKRG